MTHRPLRTVVVPLFVLALAYGVGAPWTAYSQSAVPQPPEGTLPSSGLVEPGPATGPEGLFRAAGLEVDGRQAEILYREIVEKYGDSPLADDALFALAMEHYSLGYPQTAEREFRRVFEQYPDGDRRADAVYWDGVALLAMGNLDLALERFEELTERDPASERSAWARLGIADCLRLRGDLRPAAQSYEELLNRFPSADFESAVLFHLAQVYEETGDDGSAWDLYKRLSEEYRETYEGALAEVRSREMRGRDAPPPGPETQSDAEVVSGPGADRPDVQSRAVAGDVWVIQVGAFALEENATRLARVLEAHGYADVRIETDASVSAPIHRVYVGNFSSEAEARAISRILRDEERLDTRLLHRSDEEHPDTRLLHRSDEERPDTRLLHRSDEEHPDTRLLHRSPEPSPAR